MPEASKHLKKLQWKWVGISMVMYALLYLLPLLLLANSAEVLAFIWLFAGIIIISGLAGYLSKEVTIVEPAIAGAGLILLFFVGQILFTPRQIRMQGIWIPVVITAVGVFVLSLVGSWLGERAQKLFKTQPPEQAEELGKP
jgi:hypothetical protein